MRKRQQFIEKEEKSRKIAEVSIKCKKKSMNRKTNDDILHIGVGGRMGRREQHTRTHA